jgi:hypothetical protein
MKQVITNQLRRLASSTRLLVLTAAVLLGSALSSQASHFRYHSVSWTAGTDDTIIFQVTQAWRWSAFGNPALNTVQPISSFTFGDATATSFSLTVTSINAADDWFTGVTTIKHKYPAGPGVYTFQYSDCCRIGGLQEGNSGLSQLMRTTVTKGGSPQNSSPVSNIPAIVNMQLNAANTFAIPGFDPDGQTLTYSVTPTAESGLNTAVPAGLSLSSSGVITWTPTVAGLYAFSIRVSDGIDYTTVDFIMMVSTLASNPPQFDYANTPTNNFVYSINPGTPVNFNVEAFDVDVASQVSLNATGVPVGSTFTPALPTALTNPTSTAFSWTPGMGDIGSYIITFVATDNNSQQAFSSVIINVNTNPVFDVPPTPPAGTGFCVLTGTTFTQQVQASNLLSAVDVAITGVSGLPGGATHSPAIPTTPATLGSTTLSWAPTPADWGTHTVTYTATDANNKTATHSYNLLVNTSPQFTSALPVSTATEGIAYSHLFTGTDANTPYGDVLEYHPTGLPSWLTLTDNNDGTATLTGTPGVGDIGTHTFDITLEDIHHHCGPHVEQTVTITVSSGCNLSITTTQTDVNCNGGTNGTATVIVNGANTQTQSSFENGISPEWMTYGDAQAIGTFAGNNPTEGAAQGLVTTLNSSNDVPNIDAFLNLPAGTIHSTFGSNLTGGGAIKRSITVGAGDVLTFDWNFLTQDYLPFNDVSFLSITGNSLMFLADVSTTPVTFNVPSNPYFFANQTGYSTYAYTFSAAGTYEIGFGVANRTDNAATSGLLIDNLSLNQAIVWSTNPVQTGTTATGLAAGTYTVTVVSGTNCSATASVTITEPSTPLVVTASDVYACPGASVNLAGMPAGGTYDIPNPYVGPSTPYNYFYTDMNGCTGSASANVIIGQPPVSNISVTNITGISASVNYGSVNGAGWYELRWRPVGSSTWIVGTNGTATTKMLISLIPNTNYEVEVRTYCSTTLPPGPWTSAYFTTNNLCSVPTNLFANNIAGNSAKLNWDAVSGIAFYSVRYKKSSSSTWTTTSSLVNSKSISGLTTSTSYDFQVRSHCAGSAGAWSATSTFMTAASKGAATIEKTTVDEVSIQVYPNPTTSETNVEFSSAAASMATLKVVDMSGRIVKQQDAMVEEGFNIVTLNLADLTNGIYIIQVYSNDQLKVASRVMKN